MFDKNPDTTVKFVKEPESSPIKTIPVTAVSTPLEAVSESDVVLTVLPGPQHVKDFFATLITDLPVTEGIDERLFIDCSTIDPATSRSVASLVHSKGKGKFVDAPMSGGVVGATAGSLTFMLDCPSFAQDVVEARVVPVLEKLGRKIWRLGGQGAGLSGKLANNYLLAICNIATAEAFNLGIKWGLDPKVLADVVNSSSGRNCCSENNNPLPQISLGAPANRDYEGGFAISLMKKDLKLAIAAAEEAGAQLELADRAEQVYTATEDEYKDKDLSVIYRYLQDQNRKFQTKTVREV